jgi:hypothetical protein
MKGGWKTLSPGSEIMAIPLSDDVYREGSGWRMNVTRLNF